MLKRQTFLLLLCHLFLGIKLCAQIDTSLVLDEVKFLVEPTRNQNLGGKTQIIFHESLRKQQQDLGESLNQNGGIYIKSYGANSLATSSIRGGSAGHTLLLWNGIPLVNPSLGLVDFALIPSGQVDQITLQKGGNSALWGSGAIGGVINLQNKTVITENYSSIGAQVGSFGQLILDAKAEYTKGRFGASTNISFRKSDNDFDFQAFEGSPIEQLKNAGFTSNNISQNLFFKLNQKHKLNVHYWWQSSYKEIPATLTQTENQSFQEDIANRFLIDWKLINNKSKIQAKISMLSENQLYTDPIIQLNSENKFVSLISELNITRTIDDKNQFLAGTTFINTNASTNGYQDGVQENKIGVWASHKIQLTKLSVQSSIRTENINGTWIPFTPSIGMEYSVLGDMILSGKISRNYRVATLNDRFWSPGGNENLLPENGWSQELGLFSPTKLFDESKFSFTVYNRRIKNWILWSPTDGQAFWSPKNLTEVWSRGFEIESNQSKNIGKSIVGLTSFYNYVKSTNEIALSLPIIAKGEQLIYTPIHQLTNTLSWQRKQLLVSLIHIYRSENKGINEDLAAYHLFNINIELRQLRLMKQGLDFRLGLNNLLGTRYFVVERRPMPLSNFNLGIIININK